MSNQMGNLLSNWTDNLMRNQVRNRRAGSAGRARGPVRRAGPVLGPAAIAPYVTGCPGTSRR